MARQDRIGGSSDAITCPRGPGRKISLSTDTDRDRSVRLDESRLSRNASVRLDDSIGGAHRGQ